jgi:RNA polymerase-binding transcription factor DksA
MTGIELEAHRRLIDQRTALLSQLADVESALQRIDEGQFGSCEVCGESIGRQRLLAIPEARACSRCAAGGARHAS